MTYSQYVIEHVPDPKFLIHTVGFMDTQVTIPMIPRTDVGAITIGLRSLNNKFIPTAPMHMTVVGI